MTMIYRKRTSGLLRSGAIVSIAALATIALILLMHHTQETDTPRHCTDDTIYLASLELPGMGLPYTYGLGDDSDKLSDDPQPTDKALMHAIEHIIVGQAQVINDQQRMSRQPMITGSHNPWNHLLNPHGTEPPNPRSSTPGACDVPEPGMLLLIAIGLIAFLIITKEPHGISQ